MQRNIPLLLSWVCSTASESHSHFQIGWKTDQHLILEAQPAPHNTLVFKIHRLIWLILISYILQITLLEYTIGKKTELSGSFQVVAPVFNIQP